MHGAVDRRHIEQRTRFVLKGLCRWGCEGVVSMLGKSVRILHGKLMLNETPRQYPTSLSAGYGTYSINFVYLPNKRESLSLLSYRS